MNPYYPCKCWVMVPHAYDSSDGGHRCRQVPGACWPAGLLELQVRSEILSQNNKVEKQMRWHSTFNLWPPHVYAGKLHKKAQTQKGKIAFNFTPRCLKNWILNFQIIKNVFWVSKWLSQRMGKYKYTIKQSGENKVSLHVST